MYGWRAKIGLLTPSVNTISEPEWNTYLPEGVSVHIERMFFEDPVTIEAMEEMNEDIERACKHLASADIDMIVYGVTSGSFLEPGLDVEIQEMIKNITGLPSVATAGSMKRALQALNIESVSVVTPYPETYNKREKAFLEAEGFNVVDIHGLGIDEGTNLSSPTPQSAYQEVRDIDTGQADGIYISGMNYRTLPVIESIEADLEKPVLSSNQVTIWDALQTVGIDYSEIKLGTLFEP